jgi:dipeptidyl aminopeptidase/acylaminoacyl peptidase
METSPTASSTGEYLAFERKLPGESRVVVFDTQSGAERDLSPPGVFDEIDSFSPDGKQIVVLRSEYPGGLGKYLRAVVFGLTPDVPAEIAIGDDAVFAPDSQSLAVVRHESDGQGSVLVVSRNGAEERFLAGGSLALFVDNDVLAVSAASEPPWNLKFLSVTDGALLREVEFSASDNIPGAMIGPDRIIFVTRSGQSAALTELVFAAGQRRQIARLPTFATTWRLYNDQAIVVSIDSATRAGNVWRVRYDDGECTNLQSLDRLEP